LEEAIVKVLDDVLFIKQNIVELNFIVWWDETIVDLGDDRCVELCKMLHQHVQLLYFSVSDNLAITYQRKVEEKVISIHSDENVFTYLRNDHMAIFVVLSMEIIKINLNLFINEFGVFILI